MVTMKCELRVREGALGLHDAFHRRNWVIGIFGLRDFGR